MKRYIHTSLLVLASVLLAACESYDFRVNDRVVYSPRPLFTDFEAPDEALRACLEQAIEDNRITFAKDLAVLNCSNAGIADLTGLSTFTGITHLKLSANNIRNLAELLPLSSLQELHLDDNSVVDPVPLYELLSLRTLDISGNPDLQCPASGALLRPETVILPQHCRQ